MFPGHPQVTEANILLTMEFTGLPRAQCVELLLAHGNDPQVLPPAPFPLGAAPDAFPVLFPSPRPPLSCGLAYGKDQQARRRCHLQHPPPPPSSTVMSDLLQSCSSEC